MRVVAALLLLFGLALASLAAPAREVAVLVTLEGVSLEHLDAWQSPVLNELLATSALALLNNKTDGAQTFGNNAVTIGAGAYALGVRATGPYLPNLWYFKGSQAAVDNSSNVARFGFNAAERVDGQPAVQAYIRATGITPPPGAVVHTRIATLQTINHTRQATIVPGLLGEQLRQAHVGVSVYGNADRGAEPWRNAVALAMNADGWVPRGDVSARCHRADSIAPFGLRTDYAYLSQCMRQLPAGRQFVVIDSGDGGRTEACRSALTPQRYAASKRAAAEACGAFVLDLDRHLRATTDRYLLILAVVSQDPALARRGNLLTPVLLRGTDVPAGLLVSPTTHRFGLVKNLDLAPTILRFYGITPDAGMLGAPLRTQARAGIPAALTTLNARLVVTRQARMPVLITYIAFIGFSLGWTLLSLFLARTSAPLLRHLRHPAGPRWCFTAVMLGPITFLAAGGLGIIHTWPVLLFLAAVTLPAAYLLHRWQPDLRKALGILGLLTTAVYCLDLFIGTPLLERSLLSYDAITGIRLYGIGNESSGILLSTCLLGLYAMLDVHGRLQARQILAITVVYVVVFVLIGGPNFGADFGGMLSALPGFGTALVLASQGPLRRQVLRAVGLAGVGLFLAMLVVNLCGKNSHISQAFGTALAHHPGVLVDAALRKWMMNLRLIQSSFWTMWITLLFLGVTVLFIRPFGQMRQLLQQYPLLNAGFVGILVTLVIAMLTNDSGIAMAATGFLYLAAPLLLLALDARYAGSAEESATAPCAATP